MDIMELGAIGELVGGVAVIGSMLYIGFQIRQSTALARASAQREINASFQNAIGQLRQERRIYQRGCVDFDAMSHEDQLCFDLTVAPMINHLDQVVRMHQQGLETEDNVDAYGAICLAILQAPGARSFPVGRMAARSFSRGRPTAERHSPIRSISRTPSPVTAKDASPRAIGTTEV